MLISWVVSTLWKQTVDSGAVWITWLLKASHGQSSLNPHIRKLVSNTDKHGLVDTIKEVIINLGILCHATKQLVDQLAHSETYRMAIGFMRLRCWGRVKKTGNGGINTKWNSISQGKKDMNTKTKHSWDRLRSSTKINQISTSVIVFS